MKSRHINIPIFIPHLGCPNDCVFCNQRKISGKTYFDLNSVDDEIRVALSTIDNSKNDKDIEIAFFGGSFTGIDRNDMIFLLNIAQKYVDSGSVNSIRLSTRPDYISCEILDILAKYSVRVIELGIQSINNKVLNSCKRGHDSETSICACKLIKKYGFNLVGQMMIGLPDSSEIDEKNTAIKLCELQVDASRIYTTIVFCDTELQYMTDSKLYVPLVLGEAVRRARETLSIFTENNIPVIRLGLCSSENLFAENSIYAGAYHSAFGELVESSLFYTKIEKILNTYCKNDLIDKSITIFSPKNSISKVVGQKKCNKIKIQDEYNVKSIKIIENNELIGYNVDIEING